MISKMNNQDSSSHEQNSTKPDMDNEPEKPPLSGSIDRERNIRFPDFTVLFKHLTYLDHITGGNRFSNPFC